MCVYRDWENPPVLESLCESAPSYAADNDKGFAVPSVGQKCYSKHVATHLCGTDFHHVIL